MKNKNKFQTELIHVKKTATTDLSSTINKKRPYVKAHKQDKCISLFPPH